LGTRESPADPDRTDMTGDITMSTIVNTNRAQPGRQKDHMDPLPRSVLLSASGKHIKNGIAHLHGFAPGSGYRPGTSKLLL
jgi:hypothetical protein